IAFLFGGMMDFTLFLVELLPNPSTILSQGLFLLVSLFLVALGLLGYFNAKFPLMPYDELTHVISDRFRSEEHTSELQSRFDLVFLLSFPTRRSSDLLPFYLVE